MLKLEGVIRGPWGSPAAPRRASWSDWSCLRSSWALRGDLLKAACGAFIRFFSSLPRHVHGSPQRQARCNPHDTIHTVKTIRTQFFVRPNILVRFEELWGAFGILGWSLGSPGGLLGSLVRPWRGPWGSLEVPWGPSGGPWGVMGEPRGSLGGALGAILRFMENVVFPQENLTF